MSNLIPDKFKQWAGLAVCLISGVLAYLHTWGDMGDAFVLWSGRGAMILVIVSNVLGLSIPGVKAKLAGAGMALFVTVALMFSAGCGLGPRGVAAHTIRALQQARDLTAKQLAAAAAAKHVECKAAHGVRNQAFADCVRDHRQALDRWRQLVRPVVDSSAGVAVAAMDTEAIVKKCKARKNCAAVVLALLQPGACAIMRGLRAFGHYLSDKGTAVLTVLKAFEVLSCR